MDFRQYIKIIQSLFSLVILLTIIAAAASIYLVADPDLTAFRDMMKLSEDKAVIADANLIEDGIHVRTGLLDGTGLQEVINNCTSCHSAKLISQNRMNRDRWLATIRWMQKTQNLWDLGENEEVILKYLSKNYAPEETGRRKNLSNIEWYELD